MANYYDPPMTEQQIIAKYGLGTAAKLMLDPVHKWRAFTGIELIHREPTKAELERIMKNWKLMSLADKQKSDAKSIELFGVDNETHYKILLKSY